MINIKEFEAQKINDKFGILPGNRYEFLLYLDIPEDDELFHENGVYARVLFMVDGDKKEMIKYDLVERGEGAFLDFELEDDEVQVISEFCQKHYEEII